MIMQKSFITQNREKIDLLFNYTSYAHMRGKFTIQIVRQNLILATVEVLDSTNDPIIPKGIASDDLIGIDDNNDHLTEEFLSKMAKENYRCYSCGGYATGYSIIKIDGIPQNLPTCKDHEV